MTKLFINLIEFLLSIIKVILPFWFQPPYDFHSKALNNDQVYSCKSSMMILYNVGDQTYYNIHIILILSYDFHYFKRATLFLWNKFFLKSTASFLVLKRLFICLLSPSTYTDSLTSYLPVAIFFTLKLSTPLFSYLRSYCFHVECICFGEKFTLPFFLWWRNIFASNCVTYCVILAKNTTNLLLMERNRINIYEKQKNLGKSEMK